MRAGPPVAVFVKVAPLSSSVQEVEVVPPLRTVLFRPMTNPCALPVVLFHTIRLVSVGAKLKRLRPSVAIALLSAVRFTVLVGPSIVQPLLPMRIPEAAFVLVPVIVPLTSKLPFIFVLPRMLVPVALTVRQLIH
jgi:hypothetical protein